jgi:hypothetical protein
VRAAANGRAVVADVTVSIVYGAVLGAIGLATAW